MAWRYRSEYPILCDTFGWCRPPGEGNPSSCFSPDPPLDVGASWGRLLASVDAFLAFPPDVREII